MIYLDHNATTPIDPAVLEAMLPYLRDRFGNASSAHRLGSEARCAVEEAREKVAALIGAEAREIVFTSGGTEANNMALAGADGHVVTTAIEHSSVLETLAAQPQRSGLRLTILPVDADGRITADDVEAALTSDTSLVSVGWANNEIGTIQPVTEIAAVCRRRGVPLHSDAVQAAGKIATPAGDVDLVSLSAHKLGGPKGVGALRVRTGLSLAALLRGGSQERSRRAGTENVAGIVGFGVACELAAGRVAAAARLESLRERLWRGLADLGAVKRNSPGTGCLPNTLNVSLLRQSGDAAVAVLDLAGVAVSTGSACAAGAAEPSHVLLALGRDPQLARDALRFSLGPETSDQNIDAALRVLSTVLSVPASAFARE